MLSKCVSPSKLHVVRIVALGNARLLHLSAPAQSGMEYWWGPEKCAGREVVGFGDRGDENYIDRVDYWYPAIRFRKDDDVILAIREKEKGDWKNLSLEDKKLLYRYSFRSTMSEFLASPGYWKAIVAGITFVLSLVIGYSTFLKVFVYPPITPTFQNEWKEGAMERRLVLERGRPVGPSTFFDYEKGEWKK